MLIKFLCINIIFYSLANVAHANCQGALQNVKTQCDPSKGKAFDGKVSSSNGCGGGGSNSAKCVSEAAGQAMALQDAFMAACGAAKSQCESACVKPEEQSIKNQCKSIADNAIAQSQAAKGEASQAGKGSDGLEKALGALKDMASKFGQKQEEQKKAEEEKNKEPEDKLSSSGKSLSSSGGVGEKNKTEVASTPESQSDVGLTNSAGAGTFGYGESPNTVPSSAVGVASAAGQKNLGGTNESGLKGRDLTGQAGASVEGDYSGGGNSGGIAVAAFDSETGSKEYNKIKLERTLDKAISSGVTPAALKHLSEDEIISNGDNFIKIHEKYRKFNHSESWEDVQ